METVHCLQLTGQAKASVESIVEVASCSSPTTGNSRFHLVLDYAFGIDYAPWFFRRAASVELLQQPNDWIDAPSSKEQKPGSQKAFEADPAPTGSQAWDSDATDTESPGLS